MGSNNCDSITLYFCYNNRIPFLWNYLCWWSHYLCEKSHYNFDIQSLFAHLFSYEGFINSKIFSWLRSCKVTNGNPSLQRKYALDIISKTSLLDFKPASTPLKQNHHLTLTTGDILAQPGKDRRLIGRIIYLCSMRKELSYFVHILSQFIQQAKQEYWEGALWVVCYLKGNLGKGILLCHGSPF